MQDLEKFKNEMNLSGKNVYVGHRYKPKMFGEWDNTQIYEPLSIVQYQGNSFTSRQYVPSGIEITNEEYWASTGNYNAQVEQYRQDVRNLENNVNNLNDEVINARSGFDTLGDRLDGIDQVTGINVVETYGVDNTGSVDVMEILGSKMVNDTHLYFPDGRYLIGTHQNIENVKNLKITFSENAVIVDDFNVPVKAESSGGTTVDVFAPVGVTFVGCENLKINRLNISTPRTLKNGRMNANDKLLFEYLELRIPVFSFENCKGLVIDKIILDGYTGPSTSQYMPMNEEMTTDEIMKDYFIRFAHCESVKIKSTVINEDTGSGEIIGFYKCLGLSLGESHHDKGQGRSTFWTLYKVIDCENVEINNTNDIKTDTPGSLIDISGKNIVFNNVDVGMYTTTSWGAYALIDITKEWGVSSGNTENITINNISADGRGLIETHFSSADGSDKPWLDEQLTIDRVIVNNAKVSNMPWKGHSAFDVSSIKNTTINTLRAENIATLVKATPFFKGNKSDLYVNDFSVGVGSDHTIIQTNGHTVFENGVFYRTSTVPGSLYITNTRSEEINMYLDLSSKVTFKNTRFENIAVQITSNVEFIDCDFYNVTFKFPDSELIKPIVTFTGGNITLIGDSFTRFGLIDSPTKSPKELIFNGTKISGDFYDGAGEGLIRLSQGDTKLAMENVDINVRRVTVNGELFIGNHGLIIMKNEQSFEMRNSKNKLTITVDTGVPNSISLYNNLLDGERSVVHQGTASGFTFTAYNNMVIMPLEDAATKNTENGGVSNIGGNHTIVV